MTPTPDLGSRREVRLSGGTLSGSIVRYRERGPADGPALVFVHGLLVNGDLWRKVVPRLERRFRCLLPDLPLGGHTLPMRPEADLSPPGVARLIAEFLEALDLRDVTLVGNDTGGAFCQLLVVNHPERVGRLVLTNCDAFENFLPPAFRWLQWGVRLPGFMGLLGLALRFGVARRLTFGLLANSPLEPGAGESYFGPFVRDPRVRRDAAKVTAGISSRYTLEAARRFGSFARPVLLAWGEADPFFRLAYAERLAGAFPNARLEPVPRSRAFVPEDAPERLADLIEGFAGSRPPEPARRPAGAVETRAPNV